jgi:hypothetical protein
MTSTEVSADLRVVLAASGGRSAHARVTGTGNRLTLEVDRPELFSGARDASTVRDAAQVLADRDIAVRVVRDGVHLVTVGAVRAPWWQRRATGSVHIRVGSWRGAWTSLRARVADQEAVLPGAGALPPPTMLPIVPTFRRRRRVTTTHAPGTGSPRLVLTKQAVWEGERQPVFWIRGGETTIGSAAGCDVVLPGLEELHATVVRDPHDELVLVPMPGSEVRVHGAVVRDRQVLRTGSRIGIGPHTLTYFREEYADHGRPYGGREGGEVGIQRPQPAPRPARSSVAGP